jgi:anaerobic dimethyl sulfoxide reductase subunit B (iron-sulfur subunit)
MSYAFYFDSTYCTGCKACQVACKDKNHLPLGVLWRRVYEISGGSWRNLGLGSPNPGAGEPNPYPVWQTDVFAYNLSLACNHCEHPVCAGVCPTQAYSKREDGLVLLDASKCIGCQYCAWACPYGAPQYDADAGYMTKCNFCEDSLEASQPPACVAACPMRTLDFGQRTNLETQPGVLPAIYPMSQAASRDPNILIKPHWAVEQAEQESAVIANWEEVAPRKARRLGETPLIAFTLLTQMAIGVFWAVTLILLGLPDHHLAEQITLGPMLAVGGLIAIALATSLFHLGTPKNAWRVLAHLRKSWLSREILFTLAFAGSWLLTLFAWMQPPVDSYSNTLFLRDALLIITALTGAAGIYSMGRVYRLKTVPAWCNRRIMAGFFVTAFLLGQLLAASFLAVGVLRGSSSTFYAVLSASTGVSLVLLLGIQSWLVISGWQPAQGPANRLRLGLIGAGILGAATLEFTGDRAGVWIMFLISLVILVEETLGRWLFYRMRQ